MNIQEQLSEARTRNAARLRGEMLNRPWRLPERPAPGDPSHFMYRHFDADGRVLYIGTARQPDTRTSRHRVASPWWSRVSRIEWERHASHQEARRAEIAAIEREQPIYNQRHK